MTAWIAYAATTMALMVGLPAGIGWLLGPERSAGVWVAAAVATAVQLPAFAALVVSRRTGRDFVVSWASGMLLRFAAIAGAAYWVSRSTRLDPGVTLLSLVGFVFLLVLMEPAFLRLAEGTGEMRADGPVRTSED